MRCSASVLNPDRRSSAASAAADDELDGCAEVDPGFFRFFSFGLENEAAVLVLDDELLEPLEAMVFDDKGFGVEALDVVVDDALGVEEALDVVVEDALGVEAFNVDVKLDVEALDVDGALDVEALDVDGALDVEALNVDVNFAAAAGDGVARGLWMLRISPINARCIAVSS